LGPWFLVNNPKKEMQNKDEEKKGGKIEVKIGKWCFPSTLQTKRRKENLELQQTKEDKAKKREFITSASYKLKKKYKKEAKKRQYLPSTP
jgi:hypothetical protein